MLVVQDFDGNAFKRSSKVLSDLLLVAEEASQDQLLSVGNLAAAALEVDELRVQVGHRLHYSRDHSESVLNDDLILEDECRLVQTHGDHLEQLVEELVEVGASHDLLASCALHQSGKRVPTHICPRLLSVEASLDEHDKTNGQKGNILKTGLFTEVESSVSIVLLGNEV